MSERLNGLNTLGERRVRLGTGVDYDENGLTGGLWLGGQWTPD
jgi:hypothetical protein